MKREQIIKTLKNPHWFFFGKLFESDFEQIADAILALPLDVPSDGDVIHESSIRFVSNTGYFNITKATSFKKGAKWMRGEIIERNK